MLKFILIMTVQSEYDHVEVHRGSLIMAISGHHSNASLRNYIGRPLSEKIRACSNILSDVLSGKSH